MKRPDHRPQRQIHEDDRREALRIRAEDPSLTTAEIARRIGWHRSSLSTFFNKYDRIGEEAVPVKQPGLPRAISDEQIQDLAKRLVEGPEANGFEQKLWTLNTVGELIEKVYNIKYAYQTVWELLQEMDFTPQKPEPAAKQRDEEAISRWREEYWPSLKKGPKSRRTLARL